MLTIKPQGKGPGVKTSVALNRAERRALARHGISEAQIGKVYNRLPSRGGAAPGTLVPERPANDDAQRFGKLPETVADWEHYLNGIQSPQDFAQRFESGEFKAALNSYANQRNAEREAMLSQMRDQTEAQLTAWLKENQANFPGNVSFVPDLDEAKRAQGARPSPVYNNPTARGAGLNKVWPDFYTYLQDVWHVKNNVSLSPEGRKRMDVYNAYSEKNPADGGFLVPEEFRSQIMQLSLESAIVRPNATIIPMGAPRLHIPSVDETSRVSSLFGGVVVYRTEEGAEFTESSASFSSIKLDVTKQTALANVPNELIRDWGAFGAFMDATLPAAMAYYEDLDYISGTGAGQPLGALNGGNTGLIVQAAASGQTSGTIVWENCLGMYARMLPTSLGSAIWIASPDAFVQLATMALSVGTGGSAVWLTDGRNSPVLTLLGRPVRMTEKAPGSLGQQGDLSFVDWRQYLIGDYQTMTVDSSPHVKFTSDKTTFRAIARNDGRPWMVSPLTPHNNSATLSPYITLAARP